MLFLGFGRVQCVWFWVFMKAVEMGQVSRNSLSKKSEAGPIWSETGLLANTSIEMVVDEVEIFEMSFVFLSLGLIMACSARMSILNGRQHCLCGGNVAELIHILHLANIWTK